METCLFAELLLGNSYCIVAYFAVDAQQQVYMPKYVKNSVIHSVMPCSPIEVLQHFGGISVNICWITQHYIPQVIILHSH
jgi:hypothetical protein